MKEQYETRIARARSIANKIRAWGQEDVTDLANMIRDLEKIMRGTPIALAELLDLADLPSMPHPPYGFTHYIRAIDQRGMALTGELADEIKAVSSIVSSSRYQRGKRILMNIANWDVEDVCELQEMFAALKATFANPGLTILDVIDLQQVPTARFPRGMPNDDVWAVDHDEFALIGKEPDTVIEVGYLIEAALIAKTRKKNGGRKM
ncbi:hypothetical protein [Loktanella salsilacus]|uniref:hypothetical protein n=1 Tax=Loktanella salsilacus TaxID=195913 RepID=UPI0030F90E5E